MISIKTITIDIWEDDDLYEKFNDEVLSKELADYILRQYKKSRVEEKVTLDLNIHYKINEKDQVRIRKLIVDYYERKIIESKNEAHYSNQIIAIIMAAAVIFITLSYMVIPIGILYDIILIAGWVMGWEAIYQLFFSNMSFRMLRRRYKHLAEGVININEKLQ